MRTETKEAMHVFLPHSKYLSQILFPDPIDSPIDVFMHNCSIPGTKGTSYLLKQQMRIEQTEEELFKTEQGAKLQMELLVA